MNPEPLPASFGAWVRTLRRRLDLTQAGLGARAGCSAAAVRKIEADERKPSRELAVLLVRALAVPEADQARFLQAARGEPLDLSAPLPNPHRTAPTNLPALLTSTVDRTRDHAAVSALLKTDGVRLVTLIGPPGIGKTRLSLLCGAEALPDFPDGVWFVDLAEISQAGFFVAAVARSIPDLDLPPSPGLPQLSAALKERRLLLILDNFEHIVEQAALEAAGLLKACPRLKILATSRAPLRLYAEHEYPLPPLDFPPRGADLSPEGLMQFEAVQLLVARARQHHPDFAVTPANARAVIEIVATLEGIPLALELAAASLRHLSLEEMAALLRGPDWAARLATPARDLPPRQRTLENVIAWSYDLLDETERVFFARLGILNGWFDLASAAALAEISQERALQLLNALAGHSLLLRESGQGREHWRMLEIIREYAASRLPRRAQVEEARAGYFLARMRDLRQKTSLAACEEDFQANLQNYHAALAWCVGAGRPDLGLQIAFELEGVWSSQGYFREGLDFFRRLLDQPGEVAPAVRANAMRAASDQAWQQHDFETALWFARQAVDLGQAYGLTQENPHYLNRLGRIYIEQGDYPRAREAIGEALALAWQPGSSLPPGRPLAQLGEIALFDGDLDQADALLSQAIDLLLPEDGVFYAIAATDLAEVMLARGDYPRALGWLRAAYPTASGHIRRLIVFLGALAGCLVRSAAGSAASAAALYGAIESLCEHSGVVLGEFYRRANREGMRLARQSLSARQWAGAYEMGRAYNKAQAARRAADLLDLPSG